MKAEATSLYKGSLAAIAALLFIAAFSVAYTSFERVFHTSDERHYHALAAEGYRLASASWEQWRGFFVHWQTQDYNALFSIPVMPFMALAGDGRTSFITALGMLYLWPSVVALALIARRIVPEESRDQAFVAALLVGSISAGLWRPTLLGLPDAGGAFLFSLALLAYVRHLQYPSLLRALAVGLLVGAAILFRRHFAYAAVAFYGAILVAAAVQTLPPLIKRNTRALRPLGMAIAFVAIAGTAQVALMLAAAPEFTLRSAFTDYGALYDSFRRSPADNLREMASSFGIITLTLAAAGFIVSWRMPGMLRPALGIFLLYLVLWLPMWALVVRQITTHTGLHALLPFTVLGLTLLMVWLQRERGVWRVAGHAVLVFLAVQFLVTFTGPGTRLASDTLASSLILPKPAPPKTHHRADYQRYIDFVSELRGMIDAGEAVYVAAGSYRFNDHLISSVEEAVWGHGAQQIRILPTAWVDSRDFLPITMMTRAEWVIVADPPQTFVEEEQQLILLAAQSLLDQRSRMREEFVLAHTADGFEDGMRLKVYRRIAPPDPRRTSATLDQMIDAFRNRPLPGVQTPWIPLGDYPNLYIEGFAGGPARLIATIVDQPVGFIGLFRETPGAVLKGSLESSDCPGAVQMRVMDLDASEAGLLGQAMDGSLFEFRLPSGTGRVMLELAKDDDTRMCSFDIRDIRADPAP